jgi:hypothetical protein
VAAVKEPARCPHCGRKIHQGYTPEGWRVVLDLEHPVFTPVPWKNHENNTVREVLVRNQNSLAKHQCPKGADE